MKRHSAKALSAKSDNKRFGRLVRTWKTINVCDDEIKRKINK